MKQELWEEVTEERQIAGIWLLYTQIEIPCIGDKMQQPIKTHFAPPLVLLVEPYLLRMVWNPQTKDEIGFPAFFRQEKFITCDRQTHAPVRVCCERSLPPNRSTITLRWRYSLPTGPDRYSRFILLFNYER